MSKIFLKMWSLYQRDFKNADSVADASLWKKIWIPQQGQICIIMHMVSQQLEFQQPGM